MLHIVRVSIKNISKQTPEKMVFLTFQRLFHATRTVHKKASSRFIDSLRLNAIGGSGGNGFPKYGGTGGQGGCVYFVANDKIATLRNVEQKYETKRIQAGNGEDCTKDRLMGRRGADVEVEVPIGVTVISDENKIIGELNVTGDKCVAAGGGGGGCSGNRFLGHQGQRRIVTLDLKLIADVGLVGFPNAGKSTLLKALSRANPKIAAYPFTTIRPQIGVVQYEDLRQISVADLPGLIEGAHANVGMGHKFLKHIERTRLLIMIVDLFGFKMTDDVHSRTCLENIYALNKELELYDDELIERPCILLLNKIDKPGADAEFEKIKEKIVDLEAHKHECPEELLSEKFIRFDEILLISAKTRWPIDDVKATIRNVLDKYALKALEESKQNKDAT